MKKTVAILIIFFLYLTTSTYAQNITLPATTVETLLCKAWLSDYASMAGVKIDRKQGAESAIIEFKKDKTFTIKSDKSDENAKGSWKYDQKKKTIALTVAGVRRMNIISLKNDRLIMTIVAANDLPKDVGDVRIVYKLKK